MKPQALLTVSAVFEASIGLALLVSPALPVALLLGPTLEAPVALAVARVAGGALLALGLACWWARGEPTGHASRRLVAAMLVYNLATAATFAYGGLADRLPGIGLWPAVILHVAMAAWCIACLRFGKWSRDLHDADIGR